MLTIRGFNDIFNNIFAKISLLFKSLLFLEPTEAFLI